MNNENVESIKIELEKLSKIDKIASVNNKIFTADYLHSEYQKILSAKEKNYPTYRSEYRVIKTLIRQRNLIIYKLRNHPDILKEFIVISRLLTSLLKSIGDIFSTEKDIDSLADEFDKKWVC
jgi:hypothetical protein